MSRKFLSLTAGALLSLGLAGSAFAAGPVALTGDQMDKVTAGNYGSFNLALANANATATGGAVNVTATNATANTWSYWCFNGAASSSQAAALTIGH
jgi:hypothetical protein